MTRVLTSGDVAKVMGTTRQAVNKWLRSGTPECRGRRGGGPVWNPPGVARLCRDEPVYTGTEPVR